MSAVTFCGPQRRVNVEGSIAGLSCRDMAHGFNDLRRDDWWEAQRFAHGCLDAPDWVASGGAYACDSGNSRLVAFTVSRS